MSVLTMPRFLSVRPAANRLDTARVGASLRRALRTWLTRRALPNLTMRELADIGMSPAMAVAEAARLPWDIAPEPHRPATRLQRVLEDARVRHLTAQRTPACNAETMSPRARNR